MSEEDKKDFVVKDRRMFSEEQSESGENEATSAPQGASDSVDADTGAASAPGDAVGGDHADTPLPEINFSTFVMSLNGSALVHLGLIEDPSSGEKNKNLPMAKQIIDILDMLQRKTEGNLDKDEENILKNILYDLKIMYVKQKD